jgi:hypothetical protein
MDAVEQKLAAASTNSRPVASPTTKTDEVVVAKTAENARLEDELRSSREEVKNLKEEIGCREALLRCYEQREAGHGEPARAEFHRALQARNTDGFGEWYLSYPVATPLWTLAAPRFKVYRNRNGGIMAKEIRFASTK